MLQALKSRAAVTALVLFAASSPALSAGDHIEIERRPWVFSGITGTFDKAQLQRGFQVYKEVCSSCHGLKRVAFRSLAEPGGPEFPEEAVKTLAAEWPNQITDGPNDAGDMFDRPAKLSDPILGPHKNEKAARAAFGGAYPLDLSLITKARGVHRQVSWMAHPFLMMGDIAKGYQEGGADYVHALLVGYVDPPEGVTVNDGMYYNANYSGHQISMPAPLQDGLITYTDGTEGTTKQYAEDVAAFLQWTADPHHDSRKRIGWQVMLYLLVTTALLFLGKKKIWSSIKH